MLRYLANHRNVVKGGSFAAMSDLDVRVKVAIYRHFAETGRRPEVADVARRAGTSGEEVRAAFQSLRAQRLLLLEPDGLTIRMAPPFSGVPTQHLVEAGGIDYFANCAWDALGIPAALHEPARVLSRCEHSHEPLDLAVGVDGPEASDWLFHCLVPATKWWDDLVFT
jgi:alkylmercury lyase-like protein